MRALGAAGPAVDECGGVDRAEVDLRQAARTAETRALAGPPCCRTSPRAPSAPGAAGMVNEHTSATVFEHLAAEVGGAWLDAALVDECRGFADEERRHGVLCGAVVEALGGEAQVDRPVVATFPEHADVSRLEAVVRNLASISCLSETVAVALIGAERLEMPEGPLRELLTSIYADEVGHARFGSVVLGRLRSDARRRRDPPDERLPAGRPGPPRDARARPPQSARRATCGGRVAGSLQWRVGADALLRDGERGDRAGPGGLGVGCAGGVGLVVKGRGAGRGWRPRPHPRLRRLRYARRDAHPPRRRQRARARRGLVGVEGGGHDVAMAGSFDDAVRALAAARFDVGIVDVGLPDR